MGFFYCGYCDSIELLASGGSNVEETISSAGQVCGQ